MDLIGVIAHHGYAVTASVLLLGSLGIPMPVSMTLLAAGAAAHGDLRFSMVLAIAAVAGVLGDTLLYFGGRFTGWWLLAFMCRVSINPESCIFNSAEYFYRRGPKTLLFSRFIPGLGAMSAPLAGSLNMRFFRFLRLDAAGTLLYCMAWLSTGYLFSGFIRNIAAWIGRLGHAVLAVVAVLLLGYIGTLVVFTLRSRRYKTIEKITAESLHERMQALSPDSLVVIADVRSHGYYDPGMQRIKNSIRVEPNRLKEELVALREFMAPECEVYLYCSCIRDVTSIRVAHMLQQENCHTQVIEGGIKAWIKAGGALELVPESDVHHLPQFD